MPPASPADESAAALALAAVGIWVPRPDGARRHLVRGVDWEVRAGEHWVLLGPNGAGKTTLLGVAGGRRHPSEGTAHVLGRRLGRTDVRDLWRHVGMVDANLAATFPPGVGAFAAVLTGEHGTVRLPRGKEPSPETIDRARWLMGLLGCASLGDQPLRTCSAGERQRVLIARALMPQPPLLLLDEPATGLDLHAREILLGALEELAAEHAELATVTVTHHVEEIPRSASHALLLRDGGVVSCGPVDEALTGATLSHAFGLPVALTHADGRWAARATA